MKNSQSKFSNEKFKSESSSSKPNSTYSGCCCGSKIADEIDEVDVIEVDENN